MKKSARNIAGKCKLAEGIQAGMNRKIHLEQAKKYNVVIPVKPKWNVTIPRDVGKGKKVRNKLI
jgi:hypothetical protein